MLEYMPYVWTLVLILSVLVEAATATLTTIWFMPAGFVCLILSIFEVSIPIQVVTFIVLGILALVLAKTVFNKKLTAREKVPTNADRIIGQTAIVTSEIDNLVPSGEISVAGQHWTARSDSDERIDAGEKVTVVRIEGVKAIVTRADR